MGIPLVLLLLLFMRLMYAEINGDQSQYDECKASMCGYDGPVIRFPFRLKHQPEHCGYPGFELSCSEKNQAMLELPYSVRLSLEEIYYTSQKIIAHFPRDYCLQKKQIPNINLSGSPFQFKDMEDFTIFTCSENKPEANYLYPISCSFDSSDRPVYTIPSNYNLSDANLTSCRKIFDATLPLYLSPSKYYGAEDILYGVYRFSMNWSNPICGNCEAEGNKCQRKKKKKISNSTEPEIECTEPEGPPMDEMLPTGPPMDEMLPTGPPMDHKMLRTEVILGFFYFTLGIAIIFSFHRYNKLKREHKINIQKFLEDYRARKPSRYSYADIKRITNNFKDKLGQGAYGIVYKGKLSNDVFVAVKILEDFTRSGEEFINEVRTMTTIHHVNVVRLLGFCADGYKRALIYEFLSNESLNKFIFSAFSNNRSLSSQKLQDIAIGIAKGIEYLHHGCDQRILHLDIKPHNVLLDRNFNPKISDFGLAKLCSKEQSVVSMTAARGTIGYIAPEMLSRNFGNVSYKSDVYSFGMLLIEMVGGRKNIDVTVQNSNDVYFPEWLYNHLNQEQEVCIRIEEEISIKIVKKLSIIGLWCIQWCPIDRPSMKIVIGMLEGEVDNLVMPPNPFTSFEQIGTSVRRRKASVQPGLMVIPETE